MQLEREVARGRISAYGIASNVLADQNSILTLEDLVSASSEAFRLSSNAAISRSSGIGMNMWDGLGSRNLVAIEYPLNLFERRAVCVDGDGAEIEGLLSRRLEVNFVVHSLLFLPLLIIVHDVIWGLVGWLVGTEAWPVSDDAASAYRHSTGRHPVPR